MDSQPVNPQADSKLCQSMKKQLITFEQFIQKVHLFQTVFHVNYFNFIRTQNGFESNNNKRLILAWFLMFFYMSCNFIDVGRSILFGVSHNQNFAVLTISILCLVRGVLVTIKRKEIHRLINTLDHIFPTTDKLQQVFKVSEYYSTFNKRFQFLHVYTLVCLLEFFTIPAVLFLLYQKRDEPIHFDHQVLAGWMPFGLKNSYTAYPFVFVYEILATFTAMSFIITWDSCFIVMRIHFCMHLDMISDQILKIDARRSHDLRDAKKLYRFINELIRYQQDISTAGRDFNDLFKLSILINDFVCGVSICQQLYFAANSDEIMLFIKYFAPAIFLMFFTYDVSLSGTLFEESSAGIPAAIYNHNWYEGSNKYKHLILIWLMFSQDTLKLKGFQMLEVNMVHFKDIMMMSYQLFTFLQSRKT